MRRKRSLRKIALRVLAACALACGIAVQPAQAADYEGGAARCPQFAGTPALGPAPEQLLGSTPAIYKQADGIELRVHVVRPFDQADEPKPAVVFFFGGGWMSGAPDQFELQASHVAARGAVAILVDYRTWCRTGVQIDGQVEDAIDAIHWIRSHAGELGIDPGKIAVLGGSAGGHLALSASTFGDAASTPNLLLLFYPCVDITNEVEVQYSSQALAGFGRELSPLHHVAPNLPPAYVWIGSEDPLFADVRSYCDKTLAAGNRCEWTEYQGEGHGFFNAKRPWRTPAFAQGLAAMDEALTREGWLTP